MRVTVEDDHGRVVASYSTVESEPCEEPAFFSAKMACISALAEATHFLSTPAEMQAVELAVEAMPAPDGPAH